MKIGGCVCHGEVLRGVWCATGCKVQETLRCAASNGKTPSHNLTFLYCDTRSLPADVLPTCQFRDFFKGLANVKWLEFSGMEHSFGGFDDPVSHSAVVCCGVLWCAVVCCTVVCCGVLWCAVVCCTVLCCAVVCCAVVCCGVLWCVVLWCAVLTSE